MIRMTAINNRKTERNIHPEIFAVRMPTFFQLIFCDTQV
jgi:hypothetical protein